MRCEMLSESKALRVADRIVSYHAFVPAAGAGFVEILVFRYMRGSRLLRHEQGETGRTFATARVAWVAITKANTGGGARVIPLDNALREVATRA